jgi:hypothetical protein
MFTVTVKRACKARGVTTYYQLGQKLGGGAKFEMMAKRLWDESHTPTLPTLFAVCKALDCEIGELVQRKGSGNGKHGSAKSPRGDRK